MNTQTDLQQLNFFEEENNTLTDEVRDFITSDYFTEVTNKINTLIPSTQEQVSLEQSILLLVAGEINPDDVCETIDSLSVDEAVKKNLLILIQEKIVEELLLILEIAIESEGEEKKTSTEEPVSTKDAPSPAQVLESLKARLTQPNTTPLAPRRTTPEKPLTTNQSTEKTIDPYREKPQ